MNIIGKQVTLRAIEKNDLDLLQKWSNNPDVQYMLGGWHFPSSGWVMEEWLKRISADKLNIRLAIDHQELGLVGMANLVDINWKDGNASHGMLLGEPTSQGKGMGVDVVFSIMRYAFEELGLHRLDTTIIEFNEPSKKLYINKCGWKVEGTVKEWYWRKNRYWDKLIVGITRNDYQTVLDQTKYWAK
jgi:RimJ/RimL family protein N-acetyltransferase